MFELPNVYKIQKSRFIFLAALSQVTCIYKSIGYLPKVCNYITFLKFSVKIKNQSIITYY